MRLEELARLVAPACWSWPIPASRSAGEVADMLSAYGLRPHVARNCMGGPPAVWRFIEFHAGRCAICGRSGDRLVVDHTYGSGFVRGCLCNGCNVNEGRSASAGLAAVAGYRRHPPAAIVGYFEPHRGNGASQRVLAALNGPARVRRCRELRVAELAPQVRDLAGQPEIAGDPSVARLAVRLAAVWPRIVDRSHGEATIELLDDLREACRLIAALAGRVTDQPFLYLGSTSVLVHRLRDECAAELGVAAVAVPCYRLPGQPEVRWIPPWER